MWLHVWLTCGLEFDGTRIAGGDVYHGIPFDREGLRIDAAMEHSGSVEFLVERAGEWFEWLLSWPIERREWVENGELARADRGGAWLRWWRFGKRRGR